MTAAIAPSPTRSVLCPPHAAFYPLIVSNGAHRRPRLGVLHQGVPGRHRRRSRSCASSPTCRSCRALPAASARCRRPSQRGALTGGRRSACGWPTYRAGREARRRDGCGAPARGEPPRGRQADSGVDSEGVVRQAFFRGLLVQRCAPRRDRSSARDSARRRAARAASAWPRAGAGSIRRLADAVVGWSTRTRRAASPAARRAARRALAGALRARVGSAFASARDRRRSTWAASRCWSVAKPARIWWLEAASRSRCRRSSSKRTASISA